MNNLLQGSYFDEVTLAEMALELDAAERRIMLVLLYFFIPFLIRSTRNLALSRLTSCLGRHAIPRQAFTYQL